ncbi:MAG: WecB/TagA/CpsF family glycosyltransferase [Synergistaceae bacterium]|nr:WecB/TagA/CpsF family glycosyltransferase [Synergistaceae bacterium]
MSPVLVQWNTLAQIGLIGLVALASQRLLRRFLERDQYDYMKDILFVACWLVFGLLSESSTIGLIVSAGTAACLIGICQRIFRSRDLRWAFLVLGAFIALFGPRIFFVGLPEGRYLYLSPLVSVIVTSLWMGLFPLLLQELDQVPGLAGFLLATCWSLILLVSFPATHSFSESFYIGVAALLFLAVFWSRHGQVYRRLGEPLAAMWGMLAASASTIGVSKGVAFTTLMILPIGLFALPIMEFSLRIVSRAVATNPQSEVSLYRKLLDRGLDHPTAVRLVAGICSSLALSIALLQVDLYVPAAATATGAFVLFVLPALRKLLAPANRESERNPSLWGIRIDNVSLNFAVSKVKSWIAYGNRGYVIITPDALATLRTRYDRRYREVAREADLVLPDGMGLIQALKFLGSPVQQRIPGVEFVEQLCRLSASERWPVYFLGAKEGIAKAAAEKLAEKYPGMVVAGTHHGYFRKEEEEALCREIREAGTRILLVGLGVPQQELFIRRNLSSLGHVVAMGVGGSFDVLSGRLRRAPVFMQKLGLEWLFRLCQEPRARFRKDLGLFLFAVLVLMKRCGLDRWKDAEEA